ncbi:MAG: DUF3859 domain-containing protein [Chlamydiae bacterium]|nr:DUF3859 domain-containing protein [Chlamydiota bacterium]
MKSKFCCFLIILFQQSLAFSEIHCNLPQTQSEKISVQEAIIEDYGIYETNAGEKMAAPNVTTGYNTVVYGTQLIQETTLIPLTRGTSFGFRYLLKGSPTGATVPITIKVEHPPITNPNTHKTIQVSSWTDGAWIGKSNWDSGWQFDENWEEVPGTYTISVIYKDRVLATKSFTVKRI